MRLIDGNKKKISALVFMHARDKKSNWKFSKWNLTTICGTPMSLGDILKRFADDELLISLGYNVRFLENDIAYISLTTTLLLI